MFCTRKLLSLLLVCALLCTVLIACDDGETPSDDTFVPRYFNYNISELIAIPELSTMTLDTAEVNRFTDEELEKIRNAIPYHYVTEGTLKDGDIAVLNYVGVLAGETDPFEGGSATGAQLELGSGTYIDGFESGLVGHSVGETVVLNLTFPADYNVDTSLAGKDVTFTVTITSICCEGAPAVLTDQLVSDYYRGEYSTIAALRQAIYTFYREEVALDQLINAATMIHYPTEELWSLFVGSYEEIYGTYTQGKSGYEVNYGVHSFEEYIASDACESNFGEKYGSITALEEGLMEKAMDTVKRELVMVSAAQTGNITLTEAEYIEEVTKLAASYGLESYEEMENYYSKETLYQNFLFEKVYVYLGTALSE